MKLQAVLLVFSLIFSCQKTSVDADMSFVIEELIDEVAQTASDCPEIYTIGADCYQPYFVQMDLDAPTVELFITNAERYRELVLDPIGHLKNPLWSIAQTGNWVIYYHIESWEGPVLPEAISAMTLEYERIANQWLQLLQAYDPQAPTSTQIKVFGFVFNEGVTLADSFYDVYGDYPIVTEWTGTDEAAPWEVRFRNDQSPFDQNWYQIVDFLTLTVVGNDPNAPDTVQFFPQTWDDYTHPEGVDMFFTKFWHKTEWDAVAQRQYLKLGGNITDYANGATNYTVFAHEMGHCFFHDDIYDPGKYPDHEGLESVMFDHPTLTDFDALIQRMVWERQKE